MAGAVRRRMQAAHAEAAAGRGEARVVQLVAAAHDSGLHGFFSKPQLQQLLHFDRMGYIASLAEQAQAQRDTAQGSSEAARVMYHPPFCLL